MSFVEYEIVRNIKTGEYNFDVEIDEDNLFINLTHEEKMELSSVTLKRPRLIIWKHGYMFIEEINSWVKIANQNWKEWITLGRNLILSPEEEILFFGGGDIYRLELEDRHVNRFGPISPN